MIIKIGDLVQTDDGYIGIVLEITPEKIFCFTGNGLNRMYQHNEINLIHYDTPTNFAELIHAYKHSKMETSNE